MTLSLVAVFIPVLFMGGILGRLLHEFAVTIIVAVLVSGFVSLTLTPMLCSRILTPSEHEQARPPLRASRARLRRRCSAATAASLQWALRHRSDSRCSRSPRSSSRPAVLFVCDAEGLPAQRRHRPAVRDHRGGAGHLVRRDGQPAAAGRRRDRARRIRTSRTSMSFVGAGGPSRSLNIGRIFVTLKPRDERPDADAIVQELRAEAAARPGHQGVRAEHPGDPHRRPADEERLPVHAAGRRHHRALPVGAAGRGEAADAARAASTSPATCRSRSRRSASQIDRNKASALGVSAQAIENTLYDAYGSRQVSTIYAPTNQYWVVMELEPRYQTDPSALSLLYVRSSTGALVPLNARRDARADGGPARRSTISGSFPSVTISFDLQPGVVACRRRSPRSRRRPPTCGCRRRSPARSRARRRRSRRRCAAWASCSRSRSSSSTWCSASSTRASSIR